MLVNLEKFRFIPNAPPGVCAFKTKMFAGRQELCEECRLPITEADCDIWCCSASLLGKRKGRKNRCFWHYDCLVPAPVSFQIA